MCSTNLLNISGDDGQGNAMALPGSDNLRLSNWENFIHSDGGLDPLIKMSIAHYQLEAIHPFIDGNGRSGRIFNLRTHCALQRGDRRGCKEDCLGLEGHSSDHQAADRLS